MSTKGNVTIFNFTLIGKGVLKGTVSVNLGNGIIIHECKIIDQDGTLKAFPPQRMERIKGGVVTYHNLIDFEDEGIWDNIASQILTEFSGMVT